MKTLVLLALLVTASSCAQLDAAETDVARWSRQAQRVTITRDDWGIAHVSGKTDADAVFGIMYAQAEDDFNRVETNYLNAMGRLSEAEGEGEVFRDLRMKLFVSADSARKQYAQSPPWLKALMTSFADGLNYYLYTHPAVKPRVITHFEPWMALTFTEGSIGGDVESVSLDGLRAFYGGAGEQRSRASRAAPAGDGAEREPGGSNGIAISPSRSASHHALLWINPHTSFFFRSEAQMTSREGLNAYGAFTWGQFFVYQGFNERAGWMHTTSYADDMDEYLESISRDGGSLTYRYAGATRPVTTEHVIVPYRTATGMAQRDFTVYRTHHGPVIREENGKWVTVRMMNEPLKALTQSYTRTRARNLRQFLATMELHTNSSNNTVYADADGNTALLYSNFMPVRDPRFDWSRPVDGSDPATEWKGMHSVRESPNVINPSNGWLYNTNNWVYSAAGENSPKREQYPAYMAAGSENARGLHAIRLLRDARDVTLPSLRDAAFDSYLPAFELMIPALLRAWDDSADAALKASLAEPIGVLRAWDYRWGASSIATSLAVFYGEALYGAITADAARTRVTRDEYMMRHASGAQHLAALAAATKRLESDFGTWRTPWGNINRYQRLTGDIVQPFDDAQPSLPVPFTSSRWGSLASFGARPYPQTKKWYGTSGNSFVAGVEFGPKVRAMAVSAGGESGNPRSPHFGDQARRYIDGNLREVYFYPQQLAGHTERTYHPGR